MNETFPVEAPNHTNTRRSSTELARIVGVTSSTNTTGTTDYILAPDGRVLGQTGPNGKTYYLLKDRLGSTTTVTNEAGAVVNRYWYDPYGNYEGGQAPDPDKDIPLVHWRYTGEWLDSDKVDSGNYKIGLRYYDPAQHRWTQTDPLERVTNPGQPAESQPPPTGGMSVMAGVPAAGLFLLGVATIPYAASDVAETC